MTTTDMILACLKTNLANAKTKGMRDFCRKELEGYKARRIEREKPEPTPPKAFLRWLED